MKIASLIARILLGLMFTVFGLNGFLHFIPQKETLGPLAMQYLGALSASHYMAVVFALELIGGLLLLSGRYVPLALTLLGPVLVNILLFHLTMNPQGIGPGLVATILWLVVFSGVRSAFVGVFQPRVPSPEQAPDASVPSRSLS